jgi:hypothetical protein
VLEARYVEAGLARELAELGREQDGAGELGDGSNGAAAALLACRRDQGEGKVEKW